ncbi:hypothetical protein ACIOWG_14895 [Streptomyces sp. NPDC087658]|uniref:hypothetical protein n=1 Tax=Streptomyces sp. NPDC087658 TaxID=3365800 RepID=UPI0037FA5AA4
MHIDSVMDITAPAFGAVMGCLSDTFTTTPWKPVHADYHDGRYTGLYDVDLEHDADPRAPHKLLVHGSTLYQIAEYHALSACLFSYYNGHHEALSHIPRMSWEEARRRFLITSVDLRLHKPVFERSVPVTFTFEDVTDKYESHQLVFFTGHVDVADGSHRAVLGGCLNLRDDLI